MVQQYRELIDAYNLARGGDTRVLFTEAYASIEDTVRYYIDENGNPRSHFPFNFILIERLNENSNAADFKREIDSWLDAVPAGKASNWVVSVFKCRIFECFNRIVLSSATTTRRASAHATAPTALTA